MSAQDRLDRFDGLYRLLGRLRGPEFGGSPECAETDPELFFPLTDHASNQIALAKSVCQRCPVQGSCLAYAMDHAEQGIWGGTTESERRTLRRLRRDAAAQAGTEGVAA